MRSLISSCLMRGENPCLSPRRSKSKLRMSFLKAVGSFQLAASRLAMRGNAAINTMGLTRGGKSLAQSIADGKRMLRGAVLPYAGPVHVRNCYLEQCVVKALDGDTFRRFSIDVTSWHDLGSNFQLVELMVLLRCR